jgi:DNA (cytosine-5)-methyltransferase 1
MGKLIVINIPQIVKKRVYEVDIDKLQQVLRTSKKSKGLTCNTIAEELNLPKTKVEHWFRTDAYFDIPDSDIWLDLSRLLGINDAELTKQIMTFKFQEGLFEKSERHYFEDGLAPTILAGINDKIIVREYGSESYSTNGQHNR